MGQGIPHWVDVLSILPDCCPLPQTAKRPSGRRRGDLQLLLLLYQQVFLMKAEPADADIWGLSGKSATIVNIMRWFGLYWCNLTAKESGLEFTCVNNDDFTVSVSGGGRYHWVSMCTVWSEWVEQQIYTKFCVKLEHYSAEAIWMIQEAIVTGNWWLAASSQHACSCIMSCAEFLAKYQITQVTQPLYSPDLVLRDFWLFLKLKSPLKGKRFHTIDEIQEIWWGSWWRLGKLCEVPRCLLWRGLRCIVLCTMFLVSSSINVYCSYYMAGYLLDRSHMCWETICLHLCSNIDTDEYLQIYSQILVSIWGYKHSHTCLTIHSRNFLGWNLIIVSKIMVILWSSNSTYNN